MPVRRRAWLTREGWYYSTVLGFIIGGAVLRSVNLLVILAGMMIAMLIINWRLVMASLMALVVHRKLPEQLLAGEPLTVELTAENTRSWMSSWLLTVEDWVEREPGVGDRESGVGDQESGVGNQEAGVRSQESGDRGQESGDGDQETGDRGQGTERRGDHRQVHRILLAPAGSRKQLTQAAALIPHVPARGRAMGTYRITMHRRGRYRFGPLRVSTSFPLGLVRGQITLRQRGELIVSPRVGRLLPEWANLLEAELVGDHRRHPQRGISDGDYYGLRPWQSGDSLRWVHWRTTAKLGRPVVRQYERRRSRDVALVLDPWLPENATPEEEGWTELAISLAATAATDVAHRGFSRMTFAIAGPAPQCFSGPASAIFCQELLARLAELGGACDCAVADTLRLALEEAPPGARLIVFSPRPVEAKSLEEVAADLPVELDELVWIDASSDKLETLFRLS